MMFAHQLRATPADLREAAPMPSASLVDPQPAVERLIRRRFTGSDRALVWAMLFGPVRGDDAQGRAPRPVSGAAKTLVAAAVDRRREALAFRAEGMSHRQIAEAMHISTKTVATYLSEATA